MSDNRKFVYASWFVYRLPDDLGEFHICCGVRTIDVEPDTPKCVETDWQLPAFSMSDEDAELKIVNHNIGFFVSLKAPAQPLLDEVEDGQEYWLSPNFPDDQEPHDDWGIYDYDKLPT